MDNIQFNVNGSSPEMLLKTLELAFQQRGWRDKSTTCKAWKVSEKGFVLSWCTPDKQGSDWVPFPGNTELSAAEVYPTVLNWLRNVDMTSIELDGWDIDIDHDGHNSIGWRVYAEDWGHVGNDWAAICAIKPVYLWYGK